MKAPSTFGLTEAAVLLWMLVCLAGAAGWLINVYKLIRICCELDTWLVLRALGVVVPPLGAVVGFI